MQDLGFSFYKNLSFQRGERLDTVREAVLDFGKLGLGTSTS